MRLGFWPKVGMQAVKMGSHLANKNVVLDDEFSQTLRLLMVIWVLNLVPQLKDEEDGWMWANVAGPFS